MKQNHNHSYLIGMPGIGKSYFLNQLKESSQLFCLDLDDFIESKYQSTVPDLILTKGIELFRLYEAIALRNVSITESRTLIACGGGTPCFHDNMEWINTHGTSIYLHGTPNYLIQNYKKYQLERPLLGNTDLGDYIDKLYQSRIDYYYQAQFTIDVEQHGDKVTNIISDIIGQNTANIG